MDEVLGSRPATDPPNIHQSMAMTMMLRCQGPRIVWHLARGQRVCKAATNWRQRIQNGFKGYDGEADYIIGKSDWWCPTTVVQCTTTCRPSNPIISHNSFRGIAENSYRYTFSLFSHILLWAPYMYRTYGKTYGHLPVRQYTKAAISTLLDSSDSLLLLENLEQAIKKIGHRLTVNLGAQMTVLYTRYNW